ncbi:MAG: hypothetical protein KF760_24200 [Candidatus Eremiobacteraeota bacterium]|nr:hypothetical protein [Candidatus Eremiobacteraeota bacterium]MCW5869921.1 hypothetical protein [Candidatus Eremiobacteraeota bacterium]
MLTPPLEVIMEELIKLIEQKTGLPESQARQAAETAISFIKGKLPEPLAGQLDGLLAGKAPGGDVLGKLGGLLGG